MSVVSANQIPGINGDISFDRDARFVETLWRVITDSRSDGFFTVLLGAITLGLPDLINPYPDDPSATYRLRNISPHQDEEHPKVWEFRLRYAQSGASDDEPPDDPLDEPWEVTTDGVETEIPVSQDRNGDPIANSAGERFPEEMRDVVTDLTITIARNEAGFSPLAAASYFNKINSATTTIYGESFPAETVRIQKITGQSQVFGDIRFFRVTYYLEVRLDGWRRNVLDNGYLKLDSGNQVVIKDSKGNPLSAPSLLDGNGAVSTTPVFLAFDIKQTVDFSPLNLG